MTEHLATYLNDHLAGSFVGLELLDHIRALARGTPDESRLDKLKADIEADQAELQTLMKRLSVSESHIRKASAWVGEKAAELKMRIDDPGEGSLRLFESLEGLSIGVAGKLCLWRALKAVSDDVAELNSTELTLLIQRAEDQSCVVEDLRLAAAKRTFSGT